MGFAVKYFLCSVDGVCDNNDFGYVIFTAGLVDTTSDGEQFRFHACYKCCMMNYFSERMIGYVHVQYRCSNVILNTSICYYENCRWQRRDSKNYFI